MDEVYLEHLYTVQGYITFLVRVKTGGFCGESSFCLSEDKLSCAIKSLTKLYNSLEGRYKINDYDSDDFMLFDMQPMGHMIITGQLGGSCNIPFLKYQYYTDQTVLNDILVSFHKMIAV